MDMFRPGGNVTSNNWIVRKKTTKDETWKVKWEEFTLVKGSVWNSLKVIWIGRHMKKAGVDNGWNIAILTKMRTNVKKNLNIDKIYLAT